MHLPVTSTGTAELRDLQRETNVRLEAIIRALEHTNELLADLVAELALATTPRDHKPRA